MTDQAGVRGCTPVMVAGTTVEGGAHGYGTVFKLTRKGTLSTLHSFTFTDGAHPYGLWGTVFRFLVDSAPEPVP
jgi:uncharacterized repeat protein (TIGR03803 family)